MLLAGAARLAHQNAAFDAELRARALLVNTLLDDDPRAALTESRDAAAVAQQLGRSAWTVLLNGTAAEAALSAGGWPEARKWLNEPLTVDPEARELGSSPTASGRSTQRSPATIRLPTWPSSTSFEWRAWDGRTSR